MESQNKEYKKEWKDENLKAICAFANSDGGELYIGIDDNAEIAGISDAKKLLENLPNKINNKLGIIPKISIEKKNSKEIIKIIVSASSVPLSFDGKYYLRSGSVVLELKGIELANFLLNKVGKTWDEIADERAGIDEIDKETILKFKKMAIDRLPSL